MNNIEQSLHKIINANRSVVLKFEDDPDAWVIRGKLQQTLDVDCFIVTNHISGDWYIFHSDEVRSIQGDGYHKKHIILKTKG